MELKQLEYFTAVYKQKSFTKAAEKMFVSQQALSKAISALEEELEVKLFLRNNKGVQATEAGYYLKEKLDKILPELYTVKAEICRFRKKDVVRICLTTGASIVYPLSMEQEFLQKYPEYSLQLLELREEDCIKNLRKGLCDGIIISEAKPWAGCETFEIAQEGLSIMLHKEHELAATGVKSWNDFEGVSFIVVESLQKSNRKVLKILEEQGVKLAHVYTVNNIVTALEMCRDQVGGTVFISKLCNTISYPDILSIPIPEELFQWNLYFVKRKGENIPLLPELIQFFSADKNRREEKR